MSRKPQAAPAAAPAPAAAAPHPLPATGGSYVLVDGQPRREAADPAGETPRLNPPLKEV